MSKATREARSLGSEIDKDGAAVKKTSTPFSIDSLLDRYTGSPEDEFYFVELPGGESIKFRRIRSYPELLAIRRGGKQFVDTMEAGKTLPAHKPFLIQDREVLGQIFFLSRIIVEPKFSELDLMKLAHGCAYVFNELNQKATLRQMKEIADLEESVVKNLGESSSKTADDATGS